MEVLQLLSLQSLQKLFESWEEKSTTFVPCFLPLPFCWSLLDDSRIQTLLVTKVMSSLLRTIPVLMMSSLSISCGRCCWGRGWASLSSGSLLHAWGQPGWILAWDLASIWDKPSRAPTPPLPSPAPSHNREAATWIKTEGSQAAINRSSQNDIPLTAYLAT